jgi:hypothetical protein
MDLLAQSETSAFPSYIPIDSLVAASSICQGGLRLLTPSKLEMIVFWHLAKRWVYGESLSTPAPD